MRFGGSQSQNAPCQVEEQEPCRPRATVLLLGNTTDTPWADYLGGGGLMRAAFSLRTEIFDHPISNIL
jgi:hypothetical protein